MSDHAWPPGFFDRQDPSDDAGFYAPPRFVTHIDDDAVRAVCDLYDELGVPDGRTLDLMSSWVSHLSRAPVDGLTVLGMNARELHAIPLADEVVVQDLNVDPRPPFEDASRRSAAPGSRRTRSPTPRSRSRARGDARAAP